MIVDYRSDTVTKPTPDMLAAMMQAEVGDDVFGEDPTVRELEKYCATLLGMDGAIFCPSGTMSNQLALKALTQPYDEIICYKGAHIYKYEGGALAGNNMVNTRLLEGDRGRLTVEEIEENINPSQDIHQATTRVIALENTVLRAGGSIYKLEDIAAIATLAQAKGLKLHLDGARLFNALTETGEEANQLGAYFDTISICLSKGLGAPVGSVLAYKAAYKNKVIRARKALGGGMRQAGYLAAAGLYALRNHIDKLKADHARARKLGSILAKKDWVEHVMPVDTNIIICKLQASIEPDHFVHSLAGAGIKILPFGGHYVRLVTHLDITDAMVDYTIDVLESVFTH